MPDLFTRRTLVTPVPLFLTLCVAFQLGWCYGNCALTVAAVGCSRLSGWKKGAVRRVYSMGYLGAYRGGEGGRNINYDLEDSSRSLTSASAAAAAADGRARWSRLSSATTRRWSPGIRH
jgi:hypothetical protein